MEVDAKTVFIIILGAILIILVSQMGGAGTAGTGAAVKYQAASNLPSMVGGC